MKEVRSTISRIKSVHLVEDFLSRGASVWLRHLAVALGILLATFPVFGQAPAATGEKQNPGSVHGTITTLQDKVPTGLAGVTVKLTAVPPQGDPLSLTTDEAGRYEFAKVPAGNYTISIEQQGFKAVTKPISVIAGQSTAQDVTLEFETVTDQVEVLEETQIISTETVSAPTSIVSHRELISLPTRNEKVAEVLPITPGVIRTMDGKMSFKGADEGQSLMSVNSARTGDPVTGSLAIPVPTDAVESFSIYKTPYNAGLGSFSGGLTAIETKPPEDKWGYKIRNFIPSVLGKNGQMVGIAEATPGVNFGGPLIAHKLLFSEIFQYEMKKTTVRGLPWPDDIYKRQGFNTFTTLEAIFSPKNMLMLTVNAFPMRHQHIDINALVPQTAANDLNQTGWTVALTHKFQFDSGAFVSTIGQYTRFDSNAHGQGPEDMTISPEGRGGNYFNQWSRRGKEFQLVPSYHFAQKQWHGRHEIQVGLDIDYRSYFGTNSSHPLHLLREDGSVAQTTNFLGTTTRITSDTAVAEYVQDHWVIDSHWALDLGARLASETDGWSAAFAPRIGVAYAPGKDSKTVIRAGAGLFYNVLPLLALDFDANPTRVISLFDTAGQPIGSPVSYTNAYVGGVNPLTTSILPRQLSTTPRNLTWSTEVNHQLRSNIVLRVGYIDSHTSYIFLVNPFTGLPGQESFLGLTNTGSSHYREVESSVHFTIHKRDEVNFSYIWSRSRGDLNNLSSVLIPFEQPVIRRNVYGILPNDIPNRVLTWGIFPIIWKCTFSPLVDLHTGYPYSNIDVLQNYVGTPNGQRFNTFFSLDLKVYRTFRVPYLTSRSGNGHHIRLGAYSKNVTNHGNYNAVYNNVTSPNFGQFAGFLDRVEGAVIDFID